MKKREKEKRESELRDEMDRLRDQHGGLNYALRLARCEINDIRQECETLKAEKAALLQENIELLERMRSLLKSGVEKDGN